MTNTAPPATRAAAQAAAARIEAFGQELARLEAAGALLLTEAQRAAIAANQQAALADWRQRFDIDVGSGQRQLSWGVKVAALCAALALGMGVFLLLWRLWRHMSEAGQVLLPLLAAGVFTIACGLVAAREKGGHFARLLGTLACVCCALDAGLLAHMFNMPASPGFFLLLGAFALALALASSSRLLLAAALGALAAFVAASCMQLAGFAWDEFMRWPESWLPAAALLAAGAWALQRRGSELAGAARLVALLAWFVPAMVLGFGDSHSFLPWEEKTLHVLWQFIAGISAALLAALGVRRGWAETVYTSVLFGALLLTLKFFEWGWDALPKELFFLLIGLMAALAVALLLRLRALVGKTGQGAPAAAPRQTAPLLAQWQRAAIGTAAALATLAIGNGATLLKVRANAAQVQAQLQLSAREVQVRERVGRSATVRLLTDEIRDWTQRPYPWLTAGKMRALGFDAKGLRAEKRPVWLALELAGEAWQQEVAHRQQQLERCRQQQEQGEAAREKAQECLNTAERRLREAQQEKSRLFIVDAGRSAEELRQRWPDVARYAIVPGVARWSGRYASVELRRSLHVPGRFAAAASAALQAQHACRGSGGDEHKCAAAALPGPLLRVGARGLAWIADWPATHN